MSVVTHEPHGAAPVSAASAAGTPHVGADYPPQSYAWYVIGVLFAVTLLSQLDRQLPALLVKPIRAEFGVSDTAFSLLQGYAFAVVYTLAGLPFGRMVDRMNRRNLIAAGLVLWSAMTLLAGFSRSYEELFLTRMGVGIGEAILAPAAYSIIADYVPPERRGRALGVYYVSLAIGSGASLFLGGLMLRALPAEGLHGLPFVGDVSLWQLMFISAGVPGLLLVFALLTVREPLRRGPGAADSAGAGSWKEFIKYLQQHRATFSRLLSYPAVLAFIGYGSIAWAPAYYDRHHQLAPATAALILGGVLAGGGFLGTMVSGLLSDRWQAAGVPSARFRVTLLAWALILPGVVWWPLAANATWSFAGLAVMLTGLALAQAAAPTAIQDVVPNRMRGKAIAIWLLLGGLIGIGLGPTAIALITDHVFGADQALRYSLVIAGAPMAVLGMWVSWSGLEPYARTRAAVVEVSRQDHD